MLQPFEIFKPVYLNKLMQLKKFYLVTQTYYRAAAAYPEDGRIPLLLSDYNDLGQAKLHQNAVKHDKYAAIIHLDQPAHLRKLQELLSQDSPYCLYWAVVASAKALQQIIDKKYKDHLRRYLTRNSHWRIRGDNILYPVMQVSFGELFIIIKHGSERIRVKFEEIENA